jgi:cold shock CspA family protein
MATGKIRLFDRENGSGCVQADGDRAVHFFHRACIASGYQPKLGDRVTFQTRASPRSSQPEAYKVQLLAET